MTELIPITPNSDPEDVEACKHGIVIFNKENHQVILGTDGRRYAYPLEMRLEDAGWIQPAANFIDWRKPFADLARRLGILRQP